MKEENDKSLQRALSAKRESKYLDFKESFDPNKPEDWCEIIKDIVAMANSGGGYIIIGVKNNDLPSGSDIASAFHIRIVDDPNAPVYRRIWDDSPYQTPEEILTGALKSWRRDKTSYASESDLWTLYACRCNLQLDEEKAKCLLESSINRHAPFFSGQHFYHLLV